MCLLLRGGATPLEIALQGPCSQCQFCNRLLELFQMVKISAWNGRGVGDLSKLRRIIRAAYKETVNLLVLTESHLSDSVVKSIPTLAKAI